MVPAGNKAKSLSSVNHTTKIILHHHHQPTALNNSSQFFWPSDGCYKSDDWSSSSKGFICFANHQQYSSFSSLTFFNVCSCFLFLMYAILFKQPFIYKIRSFHSIFIPFVSGPLNFLKCQIMSFSFLFTMIRKLTEEKNSSAKR